MNKILFFNDIEVLLTFKPIKNIHLSVHPPMGNVTLSAPEGMDVEKLRVYISSKLGWIRREQRKIRSQKHEPEYLYITNESHYFFGKRYLLKITESNRRPQIVLHHSKIELIVPVGSTKEYREEKLYQWYRKELRSVLDQMVESHCKNVNVSLNNWGIRKVKTKWGSCNDRIKSIWFNIELAKKPVECIEYIVVHELIHLKERHHNNEFVMLMNRHLPNWESRKKLLNELPVLKRSL